MPDYLGDGMRKVKKNEPGKEETKEIKCMFKKIVLFLYLYGFRNISHKLFSFITLHRVFFINSIIPKYNFP